MVKKIAIGGGVLLILIGAGVAYFLSNLDGLVRSAIIRYASAATEAPVSLDTVRISLTTGEGGLSGLSIGNPKGFATPRALLLGAIKVSLDTSTVRGDGPIVIHEIDIDGPVITYEVNNRGVSNLSTIEKNAATYAASAAGKQQEASAAAGSGAPPRKLLIENLYVRDGKVGISQSLLGGKAVFAPMPTIHLTNVGKKDGGVTSGQGIEYLLSAITTNASSVGAGELARQLGSSVGDIVPGVGGLTK
jgi:uncharacterized protein involved in outer membrane biogenesis